MSKGPWKKKSGEVRQSTGTIADNAPELQVYREVYLCNDLDKEFRQVIKGEEYVIPPKGKIKMRRHHAAMVRGTYSGYNVEKSLHIEPIFPTTADIGLATEFVCDVTGETFDNEKDYKAHLQVLRNKIGI